MRHQRKNIGNAVDPLATARGFQIAETLASVLPRLTPENVSETWKRPQLQVKIIKELPSPWMKGNQNCVSQLLFRKKTKYVKEAMTALLSPVKQFVRTITFDNGKEFVLHKEISKEIECDAYFAKPCHPQERGQNENANGLLRQYFPKNMEFIDITAQQVVRAADKLNSRPRKCLNFQTPYEVFEKLTGVDVKKIMGYALIT